MTCQLPALSRTSARLLLGCCVLSASACADTDAPPPCSILQTACQEELFAATASERGEDPGELPEIRVTTRVKVRSERMADADPEPGPWDLALQELGMLTLSMTIDEAAADYSSDAVAAYYSSVDKQIVLVEDSIGNADPLLDQYLLSHELVHALQDRAVDLTRWSEAVENTADAALATRMLVEGEAVVISNRVSARRRGLDASNLDWDGYFAALRAAMYDELVTSSSPWVVVNGAFPYLVGGQLVQRTLDADGRSGVDALFDQPLIHSAAWFAGYDERFAPGEIECHPPAPPAGFVSYAATRLGAGGLLALLSAARAGGSEQLDELEIEELERRLGILQADRFALYAPEAADDERFAFTWVLRFAGASASGLGGYLELADAFGTAAQETASLSADPNPRVRVQRRGQELWISGASDALLLDAWVPWSSDPQSELPCGTLVDSTPAAM